MHSLPRTEKSSGAVTQPSFYLRKQAVNLFEGTPQQKQQEFLNRTDDWPNRSAKLSELAGMRQNRHQQPTEQSSIDKPNNNRLSIFGFRDLEGDEILFVPKFFSIGKDIVAFRKTCMNQQSVFYQNHSLQLKLTRLGGTSEFNLLITNTNSQAIQIQFELNNSKQEEYRMTKVEFKAAELLQPGKSLSENFIVKPLNMNFRYPNCTIGMKDQQLTIDLPITMLSFCKFLRMELPL